uniref:Phosphatidylcholine synthase n=1 Tax=Timspurckia oligopyrenoides TaxID=708627 RepID=A0A6T6LIY1_9RHOD|mmetsp:Transcript_11190/g.20207  ORF Transcript_11190/g.20207 Transcript_11190/m.20207 type:complete len:258 (+) Transcript_11190:61-834(+)|eukprot:CAMPEP_0182445052 /NCGR_PEP_ID=MMETSP1172-20130603/3308_1 /TAXON_ID=708627 /ORGANISM="Timspurckia oligopyrenoides, Strain CCMP3278" /LENGTH=257 /DNA_ID=CAMNT_0024640749 /DNA_START=54 /DNA_END=827 /DNA_ORIENTATION=-
MEKKNDDLRVKLPVGKIGGGAIEKYGFFRVCAAWGVHLYTGLGLPVNYFSLRALFVERDMRLFMMLNMLAVFIDATDGTLARLVDVKHVAPTFDGAQLDNIIDFVTFTFLPAAAIPASGIISNVALQSTCAILTLLASAYQFCQSSAKTDAAFVGFASYWNLILWYCVVLKPPQNVVVGVYLVLCVLSFVPIHYIYPSRTKKLMSVTLVLGGIWSVLLFAPLVYWEHETSRKMALASLFYPVYYTVASLYLYMKNEI